MNIKVKDLMTSHICCVSPDMTIENASKIMRGADIGVMPVCDDGGIAGIITDRDIIVRAISKGHSPNEKVERFMTKNIVGISPEADIKDAAQLMSDRQIRRLPVITGRELVGMISVGDIARCGKLDYEVAKAESGIAEMFKV